MVLWSNTQCCFFLTSSSSSNSLNMLSMSMNDLWMTLDRTEDGYFTRCHADDQRNVMMKVCVCLPVVCAEPVERCVELDDVRTE